MTFASIIDVKKELRFHAWLWAGYFLFEVFAYVNYDYTFQQLILIFFLVLPAKLIFIYPTIFWTVPKYFFAQKYIAFASISLGILLVSMVMHRCAYYFGFQQYHRPEIFATVPLWDSKQLFRSFEFILTIGAMFIAFSMIRLGYRQQERNNQLVTENISAELKNLKDQIKPHFLFNTLNNLYGLIKIDTQKASEVVIRLSQLMNYVLYAGNYQKVSIVKETEYLEDYIEIEKIRYGENVQIIFTKVIEHESFEIPPLILQPLVENAFKHGVSRLASDAWLKIDLTVTLHELNFKILNSKPTVDNVPVNGLGIGLKNVTKRLELMYPGSFRMKTIDENDVFLVNLTIWDKKVS